MVVIAICGIAIDVMEFYIIRLCTKEIVAFLIFQMTVSANIMFVILLFTMIIL